MLSRSKPILTKQQYTPITNSIRYVHWFHTPKIAGGERDKYELYNRQKEFGHGEITDHDRHPHLYWGLHKGRNTIQRVINQWGYAKDLKPEKIKKDLEKVRYFAKLDTLNFLELNRNDYNYIDSDANNAIGYITEDEDDEILTHYDYGKSYVNASDEYKGLILDDKCMGRPVYEWQIPYEIDVAYGYRDISTAVDILGTEEDNNNIDMKWEYIDKKEGGILLKNNETMQELLLTNINYCSDIISTWSPNTVIMQMGAERNLKSIKSTFSGSSSNDIYGCLVSLTWSFIYFTHLMPSNLFIQMISAPILLGLNGIFIKNTFFDSKEMLLKKLFKKCRENKNAIVFADWLGDDYEERINQVSEYDNIAMNINSPNNVKFLTNNFDNDSKLKKAIENITVKINEYSTNKHRKQKNRDELTKKDDWMITFRDALNKRRIDLISQVIHNSKGDRMLVCIDDIDNIPAEYVQTLLYKRLIGETKINKPVLKYDEYYERVAVII